MAETKDTQDTQIERAPARRNGEGAATERYRVMVEKLAARELEGMLGPDGARVARGFGLAFRQAAAASPQIYQCSPASVGQALALSLLTRLMPGGPLPAVYLIPRRIKGTLTLQWQASWRGLQILAGRAGYRLRAGAVYQGDEFHFVDGVTQELRHVAAEDREETWENLRGVWVVAHEIVEGREDRLAGIVFMPRRKIEARRAVSDAWRAWERDRRGYEQAVAKGKKDAQEPAPPIWVTWFEEQALKTTIRYAISRGIVQLDELGSIAFDHDGLADRGEPVEATAVEAAPERKRVGAAEAVRAALAAGALEETVAEEPGEPAPQDDPEDEAVAAELDG